MGATASTGAPEALPSIEDMDLSSKERSDDVMEDPVAPAEEPTTPRDLSSAPAAAEAPKGPSKRGRSARSPVTESPNTRPHEKLRSNPDPALPPVDEGAEPVDEEADFVDATAAGQINVEEDIDIDVVEAGPTAPPSFQAMVEDAANATASSSADEDGASAASDMSQEEDDEDPLDFGAIPSGLDDGWREPQRLLAAPSGIGSCCSLGILGELHTLAVGSMTVASVRGVEPRIVAGVEAADPFEMARAPKPYKPLEKLEMLRLREGLRFSGTPKRQGPGYTNNLIRVRLDHEASFFLLNIPWLLRAPSCDEPMGPRTPIGPIIIRGERHGGFKVADVYDIIKDTYRLATAEELSEATPKATRDNPNPPSRDFPNGPDWLHYDEDADVPLLLSRKEGMTILRNAHTPIDYLHQGARAYAERFWRRDPSTGQVRPRDAAVIDQARLPQGCMSIMRRAWTKADGTDKPRLEPDVAGQRAATYLNNNAPSEPFPRPGFDGALGVAEHVMTYLWGGGPGGDHPDMPLWSCRMLPVRGSPSTTHALKKKLQAFHTVRMKDYKNMAL